MPPGLVLDPKTGVISGTPTEQGQVMFNTIRGAKKPSAQQVVPITAVDDASGDAATFNLKVTVHNCPPGFDGYEPALVCTKGVAGEYSPTVSGDPALKYVLADGTLPMGLALNAQTGIIKGKPKEVCERTIEIAAQNLGGKTVAKVSVTVMDSPPQLAGYERCKGDRMQVANHTLVPVLNSEFGGMPTSFSGSLPAGLVLDTETGSITGRPEREKENKFNHAAYEVVASNAAGASAPYALPSEMLWPVEGLHSRAVQLADGVRSLQLWATLVQQYGQLQVTAHILTAEHAAQLKAATAAGKKWAPPGAPDFTEPLPPAKLGALGLNLQNEGAGTNLTRAAAQQLWERLQHCLLLTPPVLPKYPLGSFVVEPMLADWSRRATELQALQYGVFGSVAGAWTKLHFEAHLDVRARPPRRNPS
jgi:hypothetical protein